LAVMDATWPAAEYRHLGPWLIRKGAGGGKRVSAASVAGDWTPQDIPQAISAMQDLGQRPLFLIRAQDSDLDHTLNKIGFQIIDPVLVYAAPTSQLADQTAPHSYPHWPPLAITREIWAGIGPARIDVMARASEKTAILIRRQDRVAGVVFVAKSGNTAMLHALEVSPAHRRQGSAQNLVISAASWAQRQGADTISLVVTTANAPARALYDKLGMQVIGGYHYRQRL
jgi:ribosomal protein S18 acetylase RimI-like enzyme